MFQNLNKILGQVDDKGYQIMAYMPATLVELGAVKNDKKGRPIMSIKLKDDAGEAHKVTLNASNGVFPEAKDLNMRHNWRLKPFQSQFGVAYSGYWQGPAASTPAPTAPAYQPAQPVYQPAQPTYQPAKPLPPPIKPDLERVRSMALSYSKDLVVAGKLDLAKIYAQSEEFLLFMTEGKWRKEGNIANDVQEFIEQLDDTPESPDTQEEIPF